MQFYREGKSCRQSTGTIERSKAERILRHALAEIDTGRFIPPSQRRITVGELVADLLVWYRTVEDKGAFADDAEARWNLHLKPFFGDMRADQLGTDSLRRYRKARMDEEKSPKPTTVNRELQVLRKSYKLASKATPPKIRLMPAFEMAQENNTRMVFITEEDKQKLRDAASCDTSIKAKLKGLYLKCFVELLFGFGWRKGELTGLTVGNVNLAQGFIRIEDSKSGEPREVPLTPNLQVLLEAVCTGRSTEEPLFPAKDTRHAWKRLCKSAGVKCGKKAGGYVIHDTRRTAARTKRSAGVSESVTSGIMGWKPGSKMFYRYGIVDRADMQEALRRTEEWEREQQTKTEFGHSTSIVAPTSPQLRVVQREHIA